MNTSWLTTGWREPKSYDASDAGVVEATRSAKEADRMPPRHEVAFT
jgi:hypothetical protein